MTEIRRQRMDRVARQRRREIVVGVVIALVALAGSCWWNLTTWRECRAEGHSQAYCARMVSR